MGLYTWAQYTPTEANYVKVVSAHIMSSLRYAQGTWLLMLHHFSLLLTFSCNRLLLYFLCPYLNGAPFTRWCLQNLDSDPSKTKVYRCEIEIRGDSIFLVLKVCDVSNIFILYLSFILLLLFSSHQVVILHCSICVNCF